MLERRAQPVCAMSSASFSDAVMYPSVLRGAVVEAAGEAGKVVSAVHRQVGPFGHVPAQQTVGVLVGTALPGLASRTCRSGRSRSCRPKAQVHKAKASGGRSLRELNHRGDHRKVHDARAVQTAVRGWRRSHRRRRLAAPGSLLGLLSCLYVPRCGKAACRAGRRSPTKHAVLGRLISAGKERTAHGYRVWCRRYTSSVALLLYQLRLGRHHCGWPRATAVRPMRQG
jgi:hypothetical protein